MEFYLAGFKITCQVSGRCHVGNNSSHLSTEVNQHWAWIVLGWETAWEFQVLLTKTKQSQALLREHVSQSMGGNTFKTCWLWEVWTVIHLTQVCLRLCPLGYWEGSMTE